MLGYWLFYWILYLICVPRFMDWPNRLLYLLSVEWICPMQGTSSLASRWGDSFFLPILFLEITFQHCRPQLLPSRLPSALCLQIFLSLIHSGLLPHLSWFSKSCSPFCKWSLRQHSDNVCVCYLFAVGILTQVILRGEKGRLLLKCNKTLAYYRILTNPW